MTKSEEKATKVQAMRSCLRDVLLATDYVYSKDVEAAKKALQAVEDSLRGLLFAEEPPELYKIVH